LLKLKKLQILGFKSFCDRTELKFHGDGIAAIVGPNGCGKSNIADAIAWVLGEQSAKSLRGGSMQDVIFAGTRDRKPTGMAEVSLTLVDPAVFPAEAAVGPQIEIENHHPADDWDEAAIRSAKAEETEAVTREAQPGQFFDEEGNLVSHEAKEDGDEVTSTDAEQSEGENISAAEKAQAVILKIRRRKFQSNQSQEGEIVVTRRLFRSGDSEYLLNGKLCRLRDIQDLFMGTGLGPESYAIIEQGRIGQILSSKPHDRRAIIEEAAGVTKYKSKKRLAESRLEAAKQNLSRVNDIFDEVTRQMNTLKRQAAKAERFSKLRDEMRKKLRVVLASKFFQLAREAAEVDSQLQELAAELHARHESVQQMEQEHTDGTQRGYTLDKEIAENHAKLNSIVLELDRSTTRRMHNEERCTELIARIVAAEGELARALEQFEALSRELEANRQVLETAAADAAAAEHHRLERQNGAAAASAAVTDAERQQEARRSSMMQIISSANVVRNQITQAEENIAALDRERARLENETNAALADIESMGGRRGQLGLAFETVTSTVTALTEKVAGVRAEIAEKRAAEKSAKDHLDGLRSELATATGKRQSLEAVINEHGYSSESVKRLFASGALAGGRAPAGVLADFLEVDDKYERVVEDFMRDELNYVVVKSWDAADEGLRLLRTDVDGRATFLVHPNDSQAKFSFAMDESRRPVPRDQVLPLTRCINVLNGFGKSLEVILPKLGSGYICPDSGVARELALENPDAFYLSPSGETFHNVTVTGGKQRSEGPLSLKRELRDVLKLIGELENALRAENSRVQTLGHELNELGGLLSRLEGEQREAEKAALTHGHALQQMESEIARHSQRMSAYRVELDRIAAQRGEKANLIEQRRHELGDLETARVNTEAEMVTATEDIACLKTARDLAAQAAADAAASVAGLEERRRSAAAGLHRIETLVTEVSSRVEGLKGQIAGSRAEHEQRAAENIEITRRFAVLAQEKEFAELRVAELQTVSDQLRMRMAELDAQLKDARAQLDSARDRRGELAAQQAKLQSDFAYMGESCVNELGISADELRSDASIQVVESDALAAEDSLYREMRQRLEAMGPINMMALEEYKESTERHAFLDTQRKDLLESIENTQNTIREIDQVSRDKFEQAFHAINENFQRTFTRLFGGGQGFMRLTDEENSAESGIDIIASPPGKKMQSVLLLSGGEKALTALALLVGIFQYQPSPFCILDEVDAPLDEANVGRFADMVKELAAQTQFILITHSKRTMQAAPVMYGVTMQEPGCSKVVSVRFGEDAARTRAISA